jgi:hypothetical protein
MAAPQRSDLPMEFAQSIVGAPMFTAIALMRLTMKSANPAGTMRTSRQTGRFQRVS